VEIFKGEQSPKDALHSRFNVFDGSEVEGADEVGQLQICAISIYLLTLVQMITSNLEVERKTNRIEFCREMSFVFIEDYFLDG